MGSHNCKEELNFSEVSIIKYMEKKMWEGNIIVDETEKDIRYLGGYGWARVEIPNKMRWVTSGVFLDDEPTKDGIKNLYDDFLKTVA